MASPSEKLAESLDILHTFQDSGILAIRSNNLTRTHRERLLRNGFLQEVIKGWYIPARLDESAGESTAWYASFWTFCAVYLQYLKGKDWCLSPEQSLSLHTGNWTVPQQLHVRAVKARNNVTRLPYNTSLLVVRAKVPDKKYTVEKEALRLFSLPSALVACSPGYFKQSSTDARAALSMVRDASDILEPLLEGGHSTIAGRLAGAFRNVGRNQIADEIVRTMESAGYSIREGDPFELPAPLILSVREQSPYVNRIRLMWREMRVPVLERFPAAPGLPGNPKAYLKVVEDTYVTDAYHSLSIEGYRVSRELIEHVRSGQWNPQANENDQEHRNALAARGYWQAFQAVRESLAKVLRGDNPGQVVDDDHRLWYRELFVPGVAAGLVRPADLAGYRNGPVYIRRSMHVPPDRDAVRDVMPTLFDLLREEPEPSVRAILGHFTFVYIHPYMDGNGRMGRFLMNAMLASGGFSWTVVPVEKRDSYMAALEDASVRQNIEPFCEFLGHLTLKGSSPEIVCPA